MYLLLLKMFVKQCIDPYLFKKSLKLQLYNLNYKMGLLFRSILFFYNIMVYWIWLHKKERKRQE